MITIRRKPTVASPVLRKPWPAPLRISPTNCRTGTRFGRFHADDERLKAQPAEAGRVVFLGDSITDGWKLPTYFPGKPYVNRGISGQVTSQMLVRMYPDVIDLKPAAVALLAGTNDIARNNGPTTAAMIEENVMAITELAQAHGIKVILCSVTPIADYGRVKMSEGRPPADILKMNAWMKDYAAKNGAIYCDYFSALVDENGALKPWHFDGWTAS